MAGLPLSKGRPLYLVTKHTKFNYSGKGELCFQHRKVIHMRWTPLLFCFPQCFHYDGSFLSFRWGDVTNMPSPEPVSFCPVCVCHVLFSWADNMFVREVQTSFLPAVSATCWRFDLPPHYLYFIWWLTTIKPPLNIALNQFSGRVLKQLHSAVRL